MQITNLNAGFLKVSADSQAKATNKLAQGSKINVESSAATLSIKSTNQTAVENAQAAGSNVFDVNKVDEMIKKAQENILRTPNESVDAQARQNADSVLSLLQ